MKASRYNYIFTEGGSSYWFNGLERTFFALPAGLGEKIAEYLEQPTQLEEVSPQFYNKLVEKGFLVDDSVDELNIIRERNEQLIVENTFLLFYRLLIAILSAGTAYKIILCQKCRLLLLIR